MKIKNYTKIYSVKPVSHKVELNISGMMEDRTIEVFLHSIKELKKSEIATYIRNSTNQNYFTDPVNIKRGGETGTFDDSVYQDDIYYYMMQIGVELELRNYLFYVQLHFNRDWHSWNVMVLPPQWKNPDKPLQWRSKLIGNVKVKDTESLFKNISIDVADLFSNTYGY